LVVRFNRPETVKCSLFFTQFSQAEEEDPKKFRQLVSDLRALIKDEIEDVALRAHYISEKYGPAFRKTPGPEEDFEVKPRHNHA
jgi:hypothetical protein